MPQQVIFEGVETHYRRTAVAERAQPGVDPVDESVGRRLVEQADDVANESSEVFVRRQVTRPVRFAVVPVKKDQVNIG